MGWPFWGGADSPQDHRAQSEAHAQRHDPLVRRRGRIVESLKYHPERAGSKKDQDSAMEPAQNLLQSSGFGRERLAGCASGGLFVCWAAGHDGAEATRSQAKGNASV